MPKGSVVYVSSADGTNMNVSLADADTEATSSKTMGLLEAALATGDIGYVVTEGLLAGLNTNAATAGQAVWLSSTAGQFVFGSPPAKPAHSVYLGVVTRVQSNNGEIFVKVQNGYELEELHNVSITSPADEQVLAYEAATGLWKNVAASGGASVTISETAPASPTAGNVWFNSTEGTSYIYYDSFWVPISPPKAATTVISSASAPANTNVVWYNTENGNAYVYYDGFWTSLSGDSKTFPIQLNGQIISASYDIPAGYNGVSAGPITIASGAVVTIPTGSSWSIV
jgi:hypothetical protein